MKQSLAVICGILCVALPVHAQSGETDKKTNLAQIVATAEITKIDANKKTVQVREVVTSRATPRNEGGGAAPGAGGGRRRRTGGGGVGFPSGGRPNGGGAPRTTTSNQVKEYKIFATKDTTYKFAGADIDFTDLHVGDRITVAGTPKGSKGDLEAATITREN